MKKLIALGCLFALLIVGEVGSAEKKSAEEKPSLKLEGVPKHLPIHQEISFKLIAKNVKLKDLDLMVKVTYRPGSKVAKVEDITKSLTPVSDQEATLKWTPSSEGIVQIVAIQPKKDEDGKIVKDKSGEVVAELQTDADCAVQFADTPVLGVVIFGVAFLVLFGGMAYAFIRGS